MAGLPKLYWIVVVRVYILVLLLILEEMLCVFHQWEQFPVDYGTWLSLCSGRFLLCPFSRVSIINGCWILLKLLLKLWKLPCEFCFNVLIWCITLIDLHILKNLCIPWIYLTWSWYMILIYFQYRVCTWAPQLHNCPILSSFPVAIISLFSKSIMFLSCDQIHLYLVCLDSAYKRYRKMFLLLWLTYYSQLDSV